MFQKTRSITTWALGSLPGIQPLAPRPAYQVGGFWGTFPPLPRSFFLPASFVFLSQLAYSVEPHEDLFM